MSGWEWFEGELDGDVDGMGEPEVDGVDGVGVDGVDTSWPSWSCIGNPRLNR